MKMIKNIMSLFKKKTLTPMDIELIFLIFYNHEIKNGTTFVNLMSLMRLTDVYPSVLFEKLKVAGKAQRDVKDEHQIIIHQRLKVVFVREMWWHLKENTKHYTNQKELLTYLKEGVDILKDDEGITI